ncbi:MAG: hypothetical protein JWN39_1146, partial [Ilumatobacteraceae bacterium]|nr:hypothetical protein [Ilumatobacteraceae bacterium]
HRVRTRLQHTGHSRLNLHNPTVNQTGGRPIHPRFQGKETPRIPGDSPIQTCRWSHTAVAYVSLAPMSVARSPTLSLPARVYINRHSVMGTNAEPLGSAAAVMYRPPPPDRDRHHSTDRGPAGSNRCCTRTHAHVAPALPQRHVAACVPHRSQAAGLDRQSGSAEAVADGERGGLGPGGHAELGEDVRHVMLGGLAADEQRGRDLRVRPTRRDQ